MKVKVYSVAAVAVALAALSSTASAAPIADDGIFFSAWDQGNNTSIIVNLNMTYDAFVANPNAAYTLSGSGQAGLQNWLSTANLSTVVWTVAAANDDGTGADIPPSSIYGGLTTSSDLETVPNGWGSFGGLDAWVTETPTFLDTVNPFLAGSDAYVGSGITALRFAGGNLGATTNAAVGSSMAFYSFFANPDNSFFEGLYTKHDGTWKLSFDNSVASLAYTTAVPVPAALWLLGSGLLGLVGIGRRKVAA